MIELPEADAAQASSEGVYALDDSRVVRALQEYRAARQAGMLPDRGEVLARFPHAAAELSACLDALDFVQAAAPQLQAAPPHVVEHAGLSAEAPLGDYRLVREIGRGGMGVVYEAVQLSLGRRVAVKVLPFASALDARHLQRFRAEAQAAALLHHQGIVPVYAVGCERGVHYYAMQFIEGRTLAAVIQEMRQRAGLQEGAALLREQDSAPPGSAAATAPLGLLSTAGAGDSRTPYGTAAQLGLQAAEALEHAHRQGVVHRDIKPANLLVDGAGNVWITDFGLAQIHNDARLTLTGDLVGTLRYMSPEQALGRHYLVDQRSDVYALGATVYELLTLVPAFPGQDRQDVLRRIGEEEPRPLRRLNAAIPPELETIVLKAMAKDPEARYSSAQELADDLRRFLEDRPIKARRPSLVQRARMWSRRHRTVVVAGVVMLLFGVAGLATSTLLIWQAKRETDEALKQARANFATALEQGRLAQEQRQRARRAVDEMYTKVAEKWLKSRAGLEPVQKELLLQALAYYQQFVQEPEGDAETRKATANAYFRVGEIHLKLGELDQALEAFRQASARSEKLVEESPDVAAYREQCAQGWDAQARALSRGGRDAEAERAWRKAQGLYDGLVAENPTMRHYKGALAATQMNLGQLVAAEGRWQEAETTYRQNMALIAKLVEEAPPNANGYRINLGIGHLALAEALRALERPREAEQAVRHALDLYTVLAEQYPLAIRPRDGIATSHYYLANLLADAGQAREAEREYREAVHLAGKVAADAPEVVDYQIQLANYAGGFAQFLSENGRAAEGTQLLLDMKKQKPNDSHVLSALAWFRAADSKPAADVRESVELARQAVQLTPEESDSWRALGAAQYRAGDFDAARTAVEKAVQLNGAGDSSREGFILAMTCQRLGDKQQARLWFDRAVAWKDKHRPRAVEYRRLWTEASAMLGLAAERSEKAASAPKQK
jgi:serine/threonine protein kinase/tetratricopeptide (TPR) repeat protein